jgi:hypothetical protein
MGGAEEHVELGGGFGLMAFDNICSLAYLSEE